jgi:hypothetical protein
MLSYGLVSALCLINIHIKILNRKVPVFGQDTYAQPLTVRCVSMYVKFRTRLVCRSYALWQGKCCSSIWWNRWTLSHVRPFNHICRMPISCVYVYSKLEIRIVIAECKGLLTCFVFIHWQHVSCVEQCQ